MLTFAFAFSWLRRRLLGGLACRLRRLLILRRRLWLAFVFLLGYLALALLRILVGDDDRRLRRIRLVFDQKREAVGRTDTVGILHD